MGRLNIDISVRNKDVSDDIEEAIRSGIKNSIGTGSASGIGDDMEMVARLKIREEGAVWTEQLLNSFRYTATRRGDDYVLVFQNTAEHAAPVNDGADYGDEGPPLANLIPWVRAHLVQFWDSDGDGDAPAIIADGSGIGGREDPPFTRSIDQDARVSSVETEFATDGGGTNHETFALVRYENGQRAFAKAPDLGRNSATYDAFRNEELFTRVGETMDWEMGPEHRWSSVEIDGDRYDAAVAPYIDDSKTLKEAFSDGDLTKSEFLTDYRDQLAKTFVSHMIVDNTDFHINNMLIDDDGTIHAIDNGGHRLTENFYVSRDMLYGEAYFLETDLEEELNDLFDAEEQYIDEIAAKADEIIEQIEDVHGPDHYLVSRAEYLLEDDAEELKGLMELQRSNIDDIFDPSTDDESSETPETSAQRNADLVEEFNDILDDELP